MNVKYQNHTIVVHNKRINELTLSQQYDLLITNGKYIGERQYYNNNINLYLLEDKFHELWYFRPTNVIEKTEKTR